jgi:hypothetical protein
MEREFQLEKEKKHKEIEDLQKANQAALDARVKADQEYLAEKKGNRKRPPSNMEQHQ